MTLAARRQYKFIRKVTEVGAARTGRRKTKTGVVDAASISCCCGFEEDVVVVAGLRRTTENFEFSVDPSSTDPGDQPTENF